MRDAMDWPAFAAGDRVEVRFPHGAEVRSMVGRLGTVRGPDPDLDGFLAVLLDGGTTVPFEPTELLPALVEAP